MKCVNYKHERVAQHGKSMMLNKNKISLLCNGVQENRKSFSEKMKC